MREPARDEAFERLYRRHGRLVLTWLRVRVAPADADDLFQDVWSIFCRRWREWEPAAGLDPDDDRPVLAFLFRTCHLVVLAHRRVSRRRGSAPLEAAAEPALDGQADALARLRLGECLAAARERCSDEEVAVLTAKLSGVAARDIARTLGISEAAVDHRYRNAVARIREHLAPEGRGR